MPVLKNARHERFAQELAKGKSADEAYELAGFKANRGNASTLKAKQNVLDRISELQGRGAERAAVTVETLLAEVEEARLLAMETKQPSAAVAAIKEKGVLSGLRIEKTDNTNRNTDADRLTDAELAIIAANGSEDVAAPPSDPQKLN